MSTQVSGRLRLNECRMEHTRGGVSRATVTFNGPNPQQQVVGTHAGPTGVDGELRLAAHATLQAVMQSTRGQLQLDLMGVKLIRAFDANLVVVAVFAPGVGQFSRVVGVAIADTDAPTAAAKATLQAINRLTDPFLGDVNGDVDDDVIGDVTHE